MVGKRLGCYWMEKGGRLLDQPCLVVETKKPNWRCPVFGLWWVGRVYRRSVDWLYVSRLRTRLFNINIYFSFNNYRKSLRGNNGIISVSEQNYQVLNEIEIESDFIVTTFANKWGFSRLPEVRSQFWPKSN